MTFHALDITDGLPDTAPLPEGVEAFRHLEALVHGSIDNIIIHGEAAPTIAETAEGHKPKHIGTFEAGEIFYAAEIERSAGKDSADGMSAHAQKVSAFFGA